ncbi:MAG: PKD domain-containing protein [Myxococcota bacterium]|nr:PKD domain-containing protein [Myxococcota bacterium]
MRTNLQGFLFAGLLMALAGCANDSDREANAQHGPKTQRLQQALSGIVADQLNAIEGSAVPFRVDLLCVSDANANVTIRWDFGLGDPLEGIVTSGAEQGGCGDGLFQVDAATAPNIGGLNLLAPAYAYDENGVFQATFTARAERDDGSFDEHRENIEVTVSDIDPVIDGLTLIGPADEGIEITLEISAASISDADTITRYDVDWGDGNTSVDTGASPTHIYGDNGEFTITVTVQDEDSSVTETLDIIVVNRPPEINEWSVAGPNPGQRTFSEGAAISTTLTWRDAADDTFTVSVSACEDQSDCVVEETSLRCNLDNSVCEVEHQITYLNSGEYTATYTIFDSDGGQSSREIQFVIDEVDPVIQQVTNPVIPEGSRASIEVTAISGADNAVADPVSGFKFDCENDGFNDNETQGANIGHCLFRSDGQFTVPVMVIDEDSSTTAVATVTVMNAEPQQVTFDQAPITVDEGDSVQFPSATFLDPGADAISAAWVFEDPVHGQVQWAADLARPDDVGTFYIVERSPPYRFVDNQTDADGAIRACLVLTDDGGSIEAGCLEVTILNRPPSIYGYRQSPVVVPENVAVSLTVDASDPALDAGATPTQEPLTYTFQWGDGSPDTVLVNQPSVAHNFTGPGVYTVTITVDDDDGGQATQAVTIEVINIAPEIMSILPIGEQRENRPVSLAVFVKDQNVGELQYKIDWGDGEVTDWQSDQLMNHIYPQDGRYTVVAAVTDGLEEISQTIELAIANVAPVLTIQQPPAIVAGQMLNLNLSVQDTPSDALTFSVDWTGDGQFEPVNPLVSGDVITLVSPTPYHDPGSFPVRVRVTDDHTMVEQDTMLVVTSTPQQPKMTAIIPSGSLVEGRLVTLSVVVENINAANTQFKWDWGDGEVSEWGPLNSASHSFAQDGQYPVTVSTRDGTVELSEVIILDIANVAPRVSVQQAAPVPEGQGVNLIVNASDVASDAITFRVDWVGNGQFQPAFAVAQNDTLILGSPAYERDGIYQVRIRAYDDDTFSEVGTIVIVEDRPPQIDGLVLNEGLEGEALTLTIEASDPAGDELSYFIDWGDGQSSGPSPDTSFSHVYGTANEYTVTVTVTDVSGRVAVATTAAIVANVPPSIHAIDVTSPVTLGSTAGVTIRASDPGANRLTYRWDFDGDGVFEQSSDSSNVALHTMVDEGVFTVNVEVFDGVDTATGQTSITVVEPTVRLTLSELAPIDEGGEVLLGILPRGTGPFDVEIDWNGDGVYEDREMTGITEAGTTTTRIFPDNVELDVVVKVIDRGFENYEATATTALMVRNVPPTLTSDEPGTVARDGRIYSHQFSAVDQAGALDPLTFHLITGPRGMAVTESGELSWTPDYRDAGSAHEVTIEVDDGDGGSDRLTWSINVIVVDSDGDDLPDGWEIENFGDLETSDGQVDTDGDGLTDIEEFTNALEPTVNNAPSAPLNVYPNRIVLTSLSPILIVRNADYEGDDQLLYTFEIYDNEALDGEPAFSGTVAEGEATTSITVDLDLVDGQRYWWRAKAADAYTESPFSAASDFTVRITNRAPSAPVTNIPTDAATVTTLRPYLEVQGSEDPEGDSLTYAFDIYADETLETSVASVAGRAIPGWFVDVDLVDGMQYWWVARAADAQNVSESSAVASFTVELLTENTAPAAPVIRAPALDAVVETLTPSLVVDASSDGQGDEITYWFEVSSNPLFTGTDVQLSMGRPGTSWTPNALVENRMYYWRVRASDGQSVSDWSVGNFTVNAVNEPPTAPIILSPSNGAFLYRSPTGFSVQNAADADGDRLTYTFELSNESDFGAIMAMSVALPESQDFTTWIPDDSLLFVEGETYYWRATANDGQNDGQTSVIASFSLPVTIDTDAIRAEAESAVDDESGCSSMAGHQPSGWVLWCLPVFLLLRRRCR